MLRKLIRKLLDFICDNISYFFFRISISKYSKKHEAVIFDLDNTLVDTYPLLNRMSLSEVFRNAKVHPVMVSLLKDFSKKDIKIYILTSRKINYYYITKFFLIENCMENVPFFLVSKPIEKIKFLKSATRVFHKVTYYDDLSFNHENGEVKFYQDIINEIHKLPVSYFGYKEIIAINKYN